MGAAGASLTLGDLKTAGELVASIEQLRSTFLDPNQLKFEVESIKFGLYLLQGKLHETIDMLGDLQIEARQERRSAAVCTVSAVT